MLTKIPDFNSGDTKLCISDSLENINPMNEVYVELENSNLSTFEIKRIFHDGKWIIVEGNTIMLPSSKCILNFRFIKNPSVHFLEVEDSLGNIYYYQLFVLPHQLNLYTSPDFYSLRGIKLISKVDMEEKISQGYPNK